MLWSLHTHGGDVGGFAAAGGGGAAGGGAGGGGELLVKEVRICFLGLLPLLGSRFSVCRVHSDACLALETG